MKDGLRFCTHLIYAFVGVDPESYSIKPLVEYTHISSIHYESIIKLKEDFPKLKVLLSVGGNSDTNDPEKYMRLVKPVAFYVTVLETLSIFS